MDRLQTVVRNINMKIIHLILFHFIHKRNLWFKNKIELQQMKRKGCITTDKIHVRKKKEDKKDTGQ